MKVDNKGEYQLTNFHGQKTTHSDLNVVTLNCRFSEGQTKHRPTELFNFKSKEGQQLFKEETTNTTKITKCFENSEPFEKQAQN